MSCSVSCFGNDFDRSEEKLSDFYDSRTYDVCHKSFHSSVDMGSGMFMEKSELFYSFVQFLFVFVRERWTKMMNNDNFTDSL